ncbi:hypothetical protein [Lysinibacillus fusiformis]|uniref:hypothetical protein n=1 Tax=Lysinibacillus fusiformis TaxID=28031 RepID=UPI0021BFC528|nr:hypothetical protein [Lysinibacillus fusiformis]UXJ71368.1 hypothetical protein N5069_23380 [Lysinibacillus fusiformis]
MNAARLQDGTIIVAKDYSPETHGLEIYCMDIACRAPVHFVQEGKKVSFFKTSGKGESVHKELCAFAGKMTFERSLFKVTQFQQELKSQVDPIMVRLNTNKLDPDYVPRSVEREGNNKEVDARELKISNDSPKPPQTVSSLKSLKKLFQTADPDLLASIFISYNGHKLPITDLISDQYLAAKKLWQGTSLNVNYFIHGEVTSIVRLDKVWYFNMGDDRFPFTLVVFEKYFEHFTYTDEDLLNRTILVMGRLKKNDFNKDKFVTEMVIKADAYIEFLD